MHQLYWNLTTELLKISATSCIGTLLKSLNSKQRCSNVVALWFILYILLLVLLLINKLGVRQTWLQLGCENIIRCANYLSVSLQPSRWTQPPHRFIVTSSGSWCSKECTTWHARPRAIVSQHLVSRLNITEMDVSAVALEVEEMWEFSMLIVLQHQLGQFFPQFRTI